MLAHGIILGLPAVEGDAAVGADDVVVLVRRLDEGEESRTGELLGRGLVFVELPVELPIQKRRDPVVVLVVGLEVALDLCLFRRHVGGWIELEKAGCGRFRWGCEGTGRGKKEGTMLSPESNLLRQQWFVNRIIDLEPDPADALAWCHPAPAQWKQ